MSPALESAWTMAQAGVLGLGVWLVWKGRQPGWMEGVGRVPRSTASDTGQPVTGPRLRTARAVAAGSLWVAWPCGLLQSGLLVASLTSGAASGALAMAAFAMASSPGLLLAPWAWRHLLRGGDPRARERLAVRVAGTLLALSSAWALGHGMWSKVAAFCAAL
jgi:sulfite exporter TauE/SafE